MLRVNLEAMGDEDRRRYLFRVAGNIMADRWRRGERTRRAEAPPPVAQLAPDDDVSATFGTLSPKDRALLWLAYVEEHSHEEIAETLRVKRESVKVLLSRARARLRALLQAKKVC